MVEGLQAKLKDLQPVLEKAKVDTAELLVRLEVDQKEADHAAGLAAKDEAATAEVAAGVAVIKEVGGFTHLLSFSFAHTSLSAFSHA